MARLRDGLVKASSFSCSNGGAAWDGPHNLPVVSAHRLIGHPEVLSLSELEMSGRGSRGKASIVQLEFRQERAGSIAVETWYSRQFANISSAFRGVSAVLTHVSARLTLDPRQAVCYSAINHTHRDFSVFFR